jgi:hypothetical protein
MDKSLTTTEKELVALESHIQSIFALGVTLKEDGLTTSFALEADRLTDVGASTFAELRFGTQTQSEKLQLAMESIVDSIWEHIKAFFKKLVEYVKKAWAWLTKQEADLTESKITEAADASKQFAAEAETVVAEIKKAPRKKRGKKTEEVATEDANLGDHGGSMAMLNSKAEEGAEAFQKSLTQPEKLILFSESYVTDMEGLAKRFARQNPIQQLTSKYQRMNESLEKILNEAKQIDAHEDFSERRTGLEQFKESLANTFKSFDSSHDDIAKALDEDIVKFHGARKGSEHEAHESDALAHPDRLIGLISQRQSAFLVIREVVGQVKFTLDELKKVQGVFEELVKKIESIEANNTSKHHEAQSYAAQCLLTEAHAAIGQIRSISQGIAIFPLYFNDTHAALGKLQKHVLNIFGSTVKAMMDTDDFETDLIRTQFGKLQQAHSRFVAVRGEK